MKNIEFKIYLLIDSHGNQTAVVVEDSSQTVQVCGLKQSNGEPFNFEAEDYHLERFCKQYEIELRVTSECLDFQMTWDAVEVFKPTERVLYIPPHANGLTFHKDCQIGIVSSVRGLPGDQTVFVRFGQGETAANTPIKNLQKW